MKVVPEIVHYIICLDFKFYQTYIIWISDETDKVVVDDEERIIGFTTLPATLNFINATGLNVCDEVTEFKTYKLQQWLTNAKEDFDYVEFLNFWNLCTDISESVHIKFEGDTKDEVRNSIYDKLFNASGTFISDNPNPIFNTKELKVLNGIIKNGLNILLNNMVIGEEGILNHSPLT